jgi:protein gp37
MSLNPTGIEWTHCYGPGSGRTWNPVVGCTAGCALATTGYDCYARKMAKRQKQNCQACYDFTPHLHADRLHDLAHIGQRYGIFIGSIGDLFDPAVPQEWRNDVWAACAAADFNTYFALTKRPDLITPEDVRRMPPGVMVGVTINRGTADDWRWAALRHWFGRQQDAGDRTLFVSAEPLLGQPRDWEWLQNWPKHPDWLIAGAGTGSGALPTSFETFTHVRNICLSRSVPVFTKDNLRVHWSGFGTAADFPRQWPEGYPVTDRALPRGRLF